MWGRFIRSPPQNCIFLLKAYYDIIILLYTYIRRSYIFSKGFPPINQVETPRPSPRAQLLLCRSGLRVLGRYHPTLELGVQTTCAVVAQETARFSREFSGRKYNIIQQCTCIFRFRHFSSFRVNTPPTPPLFHSVYPYS